MHPSTLIPLAALMAATVVSALPLHGPGLDILSPRRDLYVSRLPSKRAVNNSPISFVNDITCSIFGLQIEDPQSVLSQAQNGLIAPPSQCQRTLDTFTSLLQQCIDNNTGGQRQDLAKQPQAAASPGTGSGAGRGTPNPNFGHSDAFAPFAGESNDNSPLDTATISGSTDANTPSPPAAEIPNVTQPPPATDAPEDLNSNTAPPVDVQVNNNNAPPSGNPDTQIDIGSQSGSTSDNNGSPSDTGNGSQANPVGTNGDNGEGTNSDSSTSPGPVSGAGDNPPPGPAPASPPTQDSGSGFAGLEYTETAPASPAPAPATAPPSTPAPAPGPASPPTTNAVGGSSNFQPFHSQTDDAVSSSGSGSGSGSQSASPPAPHHLSASEGDCSGLACLTNDVGVPGTGLPDLGGEQVVPNPASLGGFLPTKSFSGAGNSLPVAGGVVKTVLNAAKGVSGVGSSGQCEGGDVSLCLDGSTGSGGV